VRRFEPGEPVALREIWKGRIWSARPATVVSDDNPLMFYLPIGVRWMCPRAGGEWLRIPRDEWQLVERSWSDTRVLSFARVGEGHATLLFFDRDWTPRTWYVNLQEPLRRTSVGFDHMDQHLDALVAIDRSAWSWKDEDELGEAISGGSLPPEDASRLRSEGERAVRRILDREPPFDQDWSDWRPDPSWPVPTLPEGWDRI
jgi:uncharacterized protein